MLSAVAVAWVGGSTACLLAASVGWLALEPSSALALAIGSGVIAAASGLPGWVQECRVGRAGQDDQRGGQGLEPQRVLLSFSSGVIIRLAGTVALLGLSSYHLPAAKETLAGIVLGWYLYLTTVEVAILATLLPRHDRRCPAEPERLSREAN